MTANLRGSLFISLCMACFIINEAIVKIVAEDLPIFQTLVVRGAFATTFLAVFYFNSGTYNKPQKGNDYLLISLRGFVDLLSTLCFFTALMHMPIANANAILQFIPLAVSISAIIIFKEKTNIKQGLSIILGFFGVIIIIQPGGSNFNIYSLFVLGSVFFVTLRELLTRKISSETSSLFVALIASLMITIGAFMGSCFFSMWRVLSLNSVVSLMGAALFVCVAYYFSVISMRTGDMSFVSPFRFTKIMWAVFIGYCVFGDFPDIFTVVGVFLVILAGVLMFYFEKRSSSFKEINHNK